MLSDLSSPVGSRRSKVEENVHALLNWFVLHIEPCQRDIEPATEARWIDCPRCDHVIVNDSLERRSYGIDVQSHRSFTNRIYLEHQLPLHNGCG